MHIVLPLLVTFALTAVAVFRLRYLRPAAVKQRSVDPRRYRSYQDGEPPEIAVRPRHLINLFETPVLFYVAVIVTYVNEKTRQPVTILAWAYVAARVAHGWIHLTSNLVPLRFRVLVLSWLLLIAIWVILGVGLLTGH